MDSLTIEKRLISFFKDGAKIVGLPGSVGEIFGLLFASPKPLTMADLVERLHISKGSASQGLKMLSVTPIQGPTLEHQNYKGGISRTTPTKLASHLQSLPPILHM